MPFTIADLIEHSVDLNPERIALETDGRSHTYAELEARSNALAHALRDLGVKPGDAVGLYSRNTIEAVEAMTAFEEGEDHPQGAKTFNGKTHQAFGIQNISKVEGGKLTVVHKTSIEDGMYPDEVDYTSQPL